jgi:hypothetical protein
MGHKFYNIIYEKERIIKSNIFHQRIKINGIILRKMKNIRTIT